VLPEPDALITVRQLVQGSASERLKWRRLLPAGLCSVGFHLFFLPLVMVVGVTFADSILGHSTRDAAAYRSQFSDDGIGEIDFDWHYDVARIETKSLAASDSEEEQAAAVPLASPTFPLDPPLAQLPSQAADSDHFPERNANERHKFGADQPQASQKAGPSGSDSAKHGKNVSGHVLPPPVVAGEMLWVSKATAKDVVYDLGCGDGRFLVAAAKLGAKAYGCDTDPERVKEAIANAQKDGVQNLVTVEEKSWSQVDLSGATIIMLHLPPSILEELKPQLLQLQAGTLILSFGSPLERCKPDRVASTWWEGTDRSHPIYTYTAPLKETQKD
jgi:hypothetical protein